MIFLKTMQSNQITLSVFTVCLFAVTQVSAKAPVLCDTAGCLNGECLQPPAVPTPVCNCSAGFQTISDPNVCEVSLNVVIPLSTTTTTSRVILSMATLHWPFIPSGRCVNYPGSYHCLCYPPSRPTFRYDYCISPPPRRQTPVNTIRNIRLLDELEIIDL